MRAKVEAWADTDAEARSIVSQISVQTSGGQVRAVSPNDSQEQQPWVVSYEIFTPKNYDLSLKTYNGGISVRDVRGRIEFDAHNGGASLSRLAGSVKGETVNGGVSITLSGSAWDGEGFDVRTRNGGVRISIPQNYAAHLETGTTNGGVDTDFPVTTQGRIGKELSIDLGGGRRLIRVLTTNGGVSITRQ